MSADGDGKEALLEVHLYIYKKMMWIAVLKKSCILHNLVMFLEIDNI